MSANVISSPVSENRDRKLQSVFASVVHHGKTRRAHRLLFQMVNLMIL